MGNISGPGGKSTRRTKATRAAQRTQTASLKKASTLAGQSVVTRTKGDKSTAKAQQQMSAAHPQLDHPTAMGTADKVQMAAALKKFQSIEKIPKDVAKGIKKGKGTNEQIAANISGQIQANFKAKTGKPVDKQKAEAGARDIMNGNSDTENAGYTMMILQMAMFTLGQQRLKTSGDKAKLDKALQDQKAMDSLQAAQKAQAKAKKGHTAGIFSKIFKWAGIALLVVIAVAAVVAAVFTGGAALPAVLLSVAAIVAVTKGVLDETGETAKMVQGFASGLQKIFPGLSDSAAKIIAQLTITIAFAAIQIACGFGGVAALTESVSIAIKVFTLINTLGQTSADVAGAEYQREGSMAMADKKKFDASYKNLGFLQDLNTKQMQELLKKLAELMKAASKQRASDVTTTKSILGNIGGAV